MKSLRYPATAFLLALVPGLILAAEDPAKTPQKAADTNTQTAQEKKEAEKFNKEARQKSPSFQEKKWTGSQGSYETSVEYDYIAPASSNLGNGKNADVAENYFNIEHEFMRHTLLAFLVGFGAQYQHQGFDVPSGGWIPDRLDSAVTHVGIDARWSEKDLLHIEAHPGFYTDFKGAGWNAFNTSVDVGYTRVVSRKLQWIIGFGVNTWRKTPYLGGAGVRWQINDRWKLKAFMPTPAVEWTARPNLTLSLRGDFLGDSYRVGPHFGDDRGAPELNNALVDYQEVRVGPGLSWNIRPTIEFNLMTGYMVGRQFDFHTGGPKLNGSGSPFVALTFHALFKLPGEQLIIPQRSRMSFRDAIKFF